MEYSSFDYIGKTEQMNSSNHAGFRFRPLVVEILIRLKTHLHVPNEMDETNFLVS